MIGRTDRVKVVNLVNNFITGGHLEGVTLTSRVRILNFNGERLIKSMTVSFKDQTGKERILDFQVTLGAEGRKILAVEEDGNMLYIGN